MSNDKKPADNLPAGLIRIRHVRFPIIGMRIASSREAAEEIAAREHGALPRGYDILYSERRQAFRFDWYDAGRYQKTRWVPLAQVATFEEWDPTIPVPHPVQPSSSE